MRRFVTTFALGSSLLVSTSTAWAQDPAPAPLAPPPPMDPNAPGAPQGQPGDAAATKEDLDRSEREDSGRNFEIFWADTSIGASYINMTQLNDSTLQIEKATSGGPAFSLGLGVRLVVLVVGARVRYNALSAFNMWQIGGEVGLKLPVKSFDILIDGHGGYSFVGSLGDASVANASNTPSQADKVKVRGFNAGLEFAIDYYLTPTFSLGAGVFGDLLFLSRPPAPLPTGLTAQQQQAVQSDPLYQKSGSSVGLELGGGLRAGVHFGL